MADQHPGVLSADRQLIEDAAQLLRDDRPVEAIRLLAMAEKHDPKLRDLHLITGLCLGKLQDYVSAAWALDMELENHSDNAAAQEALTLFLSEIGKTAQFGDELKLLHDLVPRNGLVVDVGSNVGEFSQFFLLRGNTVAAIEPLAKNFAFLVSKFPRHLQRGKLRLFNCACSETDGEATIYISDDENSAMSTLERSWVEDFNWIFKKQLSHQVKLFRLAVLLSHPSLPQEAPELLKIDTEGHDLFVLKGLLNFCAPELKPRIIMTEFRCEESMLFRTMESVELMKAHGYAQFKYYIKWGEDTLEESPWISSERVLTTDLMHLNTTGQINYGNLIARPA